MCRRAVAALLVASALLASGCATGDESGPAEAAQAATETFLYTCAIGRVTGAELNLTDQLRARFITAGENLAGCLRVMDFDLPEDPPPEEVQALFHEAGTSGVVVNGGIAEVEVRARGMRRLVELETVRGRWLISSVTRL